MPSKVFSDEKLGEMFQEIVNRVSHRQGKVLNVMNEYSVTLQQVIMLNFVASKGLCNSIEIVDRMKMSSSSVSQMIDRLFTLGLVKRSENTEDRRKKALAITKQGRTLLKQIQRARSEEYAQQLGKLSKELKSELAVFLPLILQELESQ